MSLAGVVSIYDLPTGMSMRNCNLVSRNLVVTTLPRRIEAKLPTHVERSPYGRNPKTGARVEVPAKKVPFFKPSHDLRNLVNQAPSTTSAEQIIDSGPKD